MNRTKIMKVKVVKNGDYLYARKGTRKLASFSRRTGLMWGDRKFYGPIREKIIDLGWNQEEHDSDWDGTPNYRDSSPLGIEITRGYRP